jgi:hypothetical protein
VEVHDTGSYMHRRESNKHSNGPKKTRVAWNETGVAIARNLVLAHGGEMRAVSQLGQGHNDQLHTSKWKCVDAIVQHILTTLPGLARHQMSRLSRSEHSRRTGRQPPFHGR